MIKKKKFKLGEMTLNKFENTDVIKIKTKAPAVDSVSTSYVMQLQSL